MMATSGCKDIHFQPVPCQHISDDELHFLLLLNAAGQGASEDYLLELLMEWLPPVSAARALAFVRELAFSVFTRMKSDSASKSSSYIPATVYLHGHCPDPGILRVH
ncbi:MAG: hypothetical protein H6905_10200 [Hyphomicrobiales bacterium]|nr:hypothetical protein [Hyphomicrobiales bacterium]